MLCGKCIWIIKVCDCSWLSIILVSYGCNEMLLVAIATRIEKPVHIIEGEV